MPGSRGLTVPDMHQAQSGGLGSPLPPCTPASTPPCAPRRAGQVFSGRGGVLTPKGQTTSSAQ